MDGEASRGTLRERHRAAGRWLLPDRLARTGPRASKAVNSRQGNGQPLHVEPSRISPLLVRPRLKKAGMSSASPGHP